MKKILALFLVILLTFFAVSCNKDPVESVTDDNSKKTSEPVTNENVSTDAPVEEAPTPSPEIVLDLGGRTIRHAAWWDLAPTRGKTESGDAYLDMIENIQEKYNFTLEFQSLEYGSIMKDLAPSVISGSPIVEIITLENAWIYPGLVKKNILEPLSDFEYIDLKSDKWISMATELCTFDGKTYGTLHGKPYPMNVLFINKSLLERENITNVYDLFKTKKWTWDKFLEICTKVTKDFDNDGQTDQYAINSGIQLQLIISNYGEIVRFVDGYPKFVMDEINSLEALNFYQDLIKNGYTLPSSGAWDYPMKFFSDNTMAFIGYGFYVSGAYFKGMTDDFGVILMPMGPKATEYTSLAGGFNVYSIPAGCEKPEEIAFVFNKSTDPVQGEDPDAWKAEFENLVRDEESMDTLAEMRFNPNIYKINRANMFTAVKDKVNGLLTSISQSSESPARLLEELSPGIQQTIDDIMNAD